MADASPTVLRFAPAVTVRVRPQGLRCELDCRLLFVGERLREIVRAYEEALFQFSRTADDPAKLRRRLAGSGALQRFYEVRDVAGEVAVILRDAVFREPGPVDDLDLELVVSDGPRTLVEVLPVSHLGKLGCLLPALRGDRSRAEVEQRLGEALRGEAAAWAERLLGRLRDGGYLEEGRERPSHYGQPSPGSRVTFLAHTSLLVQGRRSRVVVDPILRPDFGLPRRALDVLRLDLDAIVCSHSHWDHCNLETLLWFEKGTPVLIPRVRGRSVFNPPIAPALMRLGFTDVREVDLWVPHRVGDLELVPVPFHGEQDEPGVEIDHYTYVLRTADLSVYGGVDCFRDSFGDMRPVLGRVREEFRPRVAFLPVSRMVYAYRHGGVNGFCRYLDRTLLDATFQYTASAAEAAEWTRILDPDLVCPYALFTFSRRETPPEVGEFARALGRLGLGTRLWPLRPLDSVVASDMAGGAWGQTRRRARTIWFRAGGRLVQEDRRLRQWRPYRLARRAVEEALALGRRNVPPH